MPSQFFRFDVILRNTFSSEVDAPIPLEHYEVGVGKSRVTFRLNNLQLVVKVKVKVKVKVETKVN